MRRDFAQRLLVVDVEHCRTYARSLRHPVGVFHVFVPIDVDSHLAGQFSVQKYVVSGYTYRGEYVVELLADDVIVSFLDVDEDDQPLVGLLDPALDYVDVVLRAGSLSEPDLVFADVTPNDVFYRDKPVQLEQLVERT